MNMINTQKAEPIAATPSAESVCAYTNDALAKLDAVALKELLEKKELQPAELVDAAITRAESVNGTLNAIVVKDYERAKEAAQSTSKASLAGIPTFIKDTENVAGLPMHMGSKTLAGTISDNSSNIVKQIEGTGLISLGTTTMPEFGLTGATESALFGATANPWNTSYSTGGSSGGSAALVAAGVVPIAHANDGAGSTRIPASCCGLVGLKPTRGRLAGKEVPGFLPANIFHEGVVTRSVRDTALFYHAVEQTAHPTGLPPIGRVQQPGKRRFKVAVLTENCNGVSCDSQNFKAVSKVAVLCEELGHQVDFIRNPFYKSFDNDFWIYWSAIAFTLRYFGKIQLGQKIDPSKFQSLARYLTGYHWKNLHKVPGAYRRLRGFIKQYDQFMRSYDILLSPTLGTPTQPLGYFGAEVPGDIHLERIKPFLPFTKYQNISGAPAISLPMAFCNDGLPMGIQFAGHHGEDRLLLELALEMEQAQPWGTLADR